MASTAQMDHDEFADDNDDDDDHNDDDDSDSDDEELSDDEERAMELGIGKMKKLLDGMNSAFKISTDGSNGLIGSVIKIEASASPLELGEHHHHGHHVSSSSSTSAAAAAMAMANKEVSAKVLQAVFEKVLKALREKHQGRPCVVFFRDHGTLAQGIALYEAVLAHTRLERGESSVLVITAETPPIQPVATAHGGGGGAGGGGESEGNLAEVFYTPTMHWHRRPFATGQDLVSRVFVPSPSSSSKQQSTTTTTPALLKKEWDQWMERGKRSRIAGYNIYKLIATAKARKLSVAKGAFDAVPVPELGDQLLSTFDAQQVLLMAQGSALSKSSLSSHSHTHSPSLPSSLSSPRKISAESLQNAFQLLQALRGKASQYSAIPQWLFTESAARKMHPRANLKSTDTNSYEKKLLSNVVSAGSSFSWLSKREDTDSSPC